MYPLSERIQQRKKIVANLAYVSLHANKWDRYCSEPTSLEPSRQVHCWQPIISMSGVELQNPTARVSVSRHIHQHEAFRILEV